MKKVYSIFLVILILLGGMQLTFSAHYCGGKFAAAKISVSGEKASCGMEEAETTCPSATNQVKSHCCDDETAVYALDNNYSPSTSIAIDFSQNTLQVFHLPVRVLDPISSKFITLLTDVSPPDDILTSAISLVDICVFRI
ncbi:MAG: hypothetical protein H6538_07815 [Bacteroidales bacterium]|nr:hypothetical protein [Bacteroidales bacterium]MCB8999776.1 hypothetical protein [Bacteroidales bacterium]